MLRLAKFFLPHALFLQQLLLLCSHHLRPGCRLILSSRLLLLSLRHQSLLINLGCNLRVPHPLLLPLRLMRLGESLDLLAKLFGKLLMIVRKALVLLSAHLTFIASQNWQSFKRVKVIACSLDRLVDVANTPLYVVSELQVCGVR